MVLKSVLAASAAALALAAPAFAQDMSEAEIAALHERVLTLDTHIDIGDGYATPALDPGGFTNAQADLPKMRIGGLDAGFFIVYVGQGDLDEDGYADAHARAEEKYQGIMRMVRAYPDQIGLATSADEVEEIAGSGRIVALIGIENSYPLGPSVEDVAMWAERGARYASLTHFGVNQFGGSSNPNLAAGDSPEDEGLTELGRDLVSELNAHGIMIDVSHVGKRTGLEAMELSSAPVIASHSGARAIYDHPRNMDDEQLAALAENGGVIQVVAFRGYVDDVNPALSEAQSELAEELGLDTAEGRREATDSEVAYYRARLNRLREEHGDVTLERFVDHIDHAVEIAGIDHVGIASDFDGGGGVAGWDDAAQTLNVTRELVRRGYTESDIEKIWSGNLLRVLRAVEQAAAG